MRACNGPSHKCMYWYKNVLIKFCTNDKYLKEHIEKINYKYFHHTNGKRHHMVGSITTLWFSDDSTCDKNSLEPLFQVSKTNTLQSSFHYMKNSLMGNGWNST